jgi:hypothetical protein
MPTRIDEMTATVQPPPDQTGTQAEQPDAGEQWSLAQQNELRRHLCKLERRKARVKAT